MNKSTLATTEDPSTLSAYLVEDASSVDAHLSEVFIRSKADPHSKAFVHCFLERVLKLLDSMSVTGPLPKSAEAVDSTRGERAAAWLRRNRWHLLAYTSFGLVILLLLWQNSRMERAIEDNRGLINETHAQVLQAILELQQQGE